MNTRATVLVVISAAAIAIVAAGCSSEKSQRGGPPAVPVLAGDALTADVPVIVRTIGTVEPLNSVSVTSRVSGQILRVGFREGQDVQAGAVLFEIDPAQYQAALDQAEANLERDQAKLTSAEADVVRYTDLFKGGYVTQQEYDSVVATGAAAKATVAADRAAVTSARLALDYCTVRAPIAGRTGNLLVKQGNMVAAASGATLVTINQIAPIYVRFSLPEQRLAEVLRYSQAGALAVEASLPVDSAGVYEGELTFIDNTVDAATGTVLLKATFPNEAHALWPGQFVQVALVLTTLKGVTVIPASAVQTSQQGDYVYVIKPDGTAEQRSVVQGEKMDDTVVILKGVASGEKVVTDGQLRLTPGAKIAIKSSLAPSGAAPGGAASGSKSPAGGAGAPGGSGR
jgi:membrane fusion protein, multidrug efflux system